MTVASFTETARRFRTAAGVTLLTMSVAIVAPPAMGQKPEQAQTRARSPSPELGPTLSARLKTNLVCAEPDAGNQLLLNADGAGASLPDLLSALDALSIDTSACAQIQNAASELARQLNQANPGLDPAQAAAAAERMRQALIEADQRAAQVRFEVGPPPRNLTRNRETLQ